MIKNFFFSALLILSMLFSGVFVIFIFSQYKDFDNFDYLIKIFFPIIIGILLRFFYVCSFVYFVEKLFKCKLSFFNNNMYFINLSLYSCLVFIPSALILDILKVLKIENRDNITLSNLNNNIDIFLTMPTNNVFDYFFVLLTFLILPLLFLHKNKIGLLQILKKIILFSILYVISYIIIHASTLIFIKAYAIH